MYKTIIHSVRLSEKIQDQIHASLPGEFESRDRCILLHHSTDIKRDERLRLSQRCAVDINRLPTGFNPAEVKLMISDMDSTMITIECIDEIADFAQLKEEVSLITDAAMRGEIDFETSLQRRVALLKDLPDHVLEKVYTQRLKLSPGAEELLLGLQQQGIKTALVSGGFTFFTQRLQQRLKLDYQLANQLEVKDNRLTGEVSGEVVTASRKASFLEEICVQLSINVRQAIAIGDGANDLEMLNTAGLGVAYRAKTIVQQQADVALNYSGLNALLDFIHAI